VKAEGVELGGDGLQAGQLLVGVALAVDKLAADLRSGQAAIQAGGPEGGIGLDVVLYRRSVRLSDAYNKGG
jgi:hypothetical protein